MHHFCPGGPCGYQAATKLHVMYPSRSLPLVSSMGTFCSQDFKGRRPGTHLGLLHECDDVVDHLIIMFHVGAIRIQRPICIKRDQTQPPRTGMHLN